MKAFELAPRIAEYASMGEFCAQANLGRNDLILTNEYIYEPFIGGLNTGCQTVFVERYGAGEPTDVMIDAILNDIRCFRFGRVIAVGGGTVIDIAKVIAAAGPADCLDALFERESLVKTHPLYIVPTTCGTGSEATCISIINRTRMGAKLGLVSPALYADQAALIPELLGTLPYGVFATSSIDAAIHAVESYLSPGACTLSELFSKSALELIIEGWIFAVSNGADSWKARAAEFLRAANYAGIAFGHAGCAAVHAMSYPLGGKHHIPHGQANQLMFPGVMRKYQEKKPIGKLNSLEDIISRILGCEPVFALEKLYGLMDAVLPRVSLSSLGVTEDELAKFVAEVCKTQQRLTQNSYVQLTAEDMLYVYRESF